MKKTLFSIALLYSFAGLSIMAQSIDTYEQFFTSSSAFLNAVVFDDKVNYAELDVAALESLVAFIEEHDALNQEDDIQKAFAINAYNLLVINQIRGQYPLSSVQKIAGFFDRNRVKVGGEEYTLNDYEKGIFARYPDPRLHFALSCAANSCPPLASQAFTPQNLEALLEARTRRALNDDDFVRTTTEDRVGLSQIFSWYRSDFGGSNEDMISYINGYRERPITSSASVQFYPYDWSLNDASVTSTNSARYVVSSTRPKGTIEIKWFNNLYTQQIPSTALQESYFTSLFGFLYGVSDRVNVGFDIRQRYSAFHAEPSGAFNAFSPALRSRSAIATIGPKVRIAPNVKWPNMSIQSAVWFPVADQLEGRGEQPWIDWDKPTWFTQIWNDFSIGDSYAFFLELDLFWEDIALGDPNETNRFATPITGIFSFFPTAKSTLYSLVNFSPIWRPNADYWAQAGLGAKYQLHQNFEVELLYTYFFNQFLIDLNGRASTFNIGFRYSN